MRRTFLELAISYLIDDVNIHLLASMASEGRDIQDLLNNIVRRRIDSNRRYIDEVLEKILERHKRHYFEMFLNEVKRMESEEKAGNLQGAFQHKVMADTYKGILEKAFGVTDSA